MGNLFYASSCIERCVLHGDEGAIAIYVSRYVSAFLLLVRNILEELSSINQISVNFCRCCQCQTCRAHCIHENRAATTNQRLSNTNTKPNNAPTLRTPSHAKVELPQFIYESRCWNLYKQLEAFDTRLQRHKLQRFIIAAEKTDETFSR